VAEGSDQRSVIRRDIRILISLGSTDYYSGHTVIYKKMAGRDGRPNLLAITMSIGI